MKHSRNFLSTVRSSRAAHQAARGRRRTLERELAAFSSPADRLELDLMIGRYPAEETREVREILDHQAIRSAA